MKHISHIFLALLTATVCGACTKDDSDTPEQEARRTMIVYLNGENNISQYATNDLNEMTEGSKTLPSDCNLIVYVDNVEGTDATTGQRTMPYICKLAGGVSTTVKTLSSDVNSSSPVEMKSILQWIIDKYPARSLGIDFWGHGTGSIITNDTIAVTSGARGGTHSYSVTAYGADNGKNSESAPVQTYNWINIPTMAKTLNSLTKSDGTQAHLDFLFFDACLMQSAEIAYEFRGTTDYLIGSCSEIPAFGAPYKAMVPVFAETSPEQVAKDIVNTYIDSNTWGTDIDQSDGVCISAVRTSALDELLKATRSVNDTADISGAIPYRPDLDEKYNNLSSCIYYWITSKQPIFYDINDVMLHHLSAEDYTIWKTALDKAVIAKRHPRDIRQLSENICDWVPATLTSRNYYYSFLLDDTTYGGLSLFIPDAIYSTKTNPDMNQAMYQYEWCNRVGWKAKGW